MARELNDPFGSIVPPLYLGVAFAHKSSESAQRAFEVLGNGYAYSRMGSPTVTLFEEFLAELEKAPKRSVWVTASGLSVLGSLLVPGLTSKRAGGKKKIVTSSYIYGGSFHQLALWRDDHGYDVVFVDDPFSIDSWQEAVDDGTAFVFLETPCNPTIDVFDIKAIADIAHSCGSWLIVDNTLAPNLQWPLDLGADAVLHSVTKALNRQSIGLGGALVGDRAFLDAFEGILDDYQVAMGPTMHPFTAWFVLNNAPTLKRDMVDFSEIAMGVASFLEHHLKIQKVHYPFLLSSRSYTVAREQMCGAGGLLSFEMESFEAAQKLVELLRVPYLAPHLGHTESLVIHPASTTHGKLSKEQLAAVNITPEMVRYSVGLGVPKEVIKEITKDFDQALSKI